MYPAHLVSICIDAGKLCLIIVRHMTKPVCGVAMKALEGGREGGREGGQEGVDGWRLGNGVEFHTLSMLLLCNYGMVRQSGRLEVLWVH